MTATYLFYDIETSGLNKCFDQIYQFAAIRTDLKLNTLERHSLTIKPNCDIFPTPAAVMTHQLSPALLKDGLSEVEALEKIHAWMNTPGTISLGYNTLRFDDEFLRFSFYRHLLSPYTHQYEGQCKRMDLYPLLIFFHLYKPEALPHWPVLDGQVSLKLENLNAANQWVQGRAHDAMVDVEVTVALAKHCMAEATMWGYLTGYFNKSVDQQRCSALPVGLTCQGRAYLEGILILGQFGTKCAYQAPVLDLGDHAHYKNQRLWLRLDLPELRKATLDNVDEMTWVVSKKYAEPGFLLPPTPERLAKMTENRQQEAEANKAWLAAHPMILKAILEYHRHYRYPVLPETDVDAALYHQKFFTPLEREQCRAFHRAEPADKTACVMRMKNPVLQRLAIRILGRHYPEHLSLEHRALFSQYLQTVFSRDTDSLPIDFKGGRRLGFSEAMAAISALRDTRELGNDQQRLLTELAGYYHALIER